MDRDEILELSRKENQNRDLAERETAVQAWSIAGRVGATACCLVSMLFCAFTGTVPFAPWIIYFSTMGAQYAVRSSRLRQKSDLFLCALFFVMCFVALVFFVLRLAGIVG